MCRTVEDAAILLQAIAGYDPQEPTSANVAVPDYAAAFKIKVAPMKLGIPRKTFYDSLHPEIASAVDEAINVLKKLTAGVHDVQLPAIPNSPVLSAEAYAYHAQYFTKTPDRYQPQTRRNLEGGARVTAEAYIRARRDLDRIRREVADVFSNCDLLITPTTPIPPFTIADAASGNGSSLRNTAPFDSYGLPTMSVPCDSRNAGLPIGLQISGPNFAETRVLALSHAYERATNGISASRRWHERSQGAMPMRKLVASTMMWSSLGTKVTRTEVELGLRGIRIFVVAASSVPLSYKVS